MSATGRSAASLARDPSDFYVTPPWCVDAILPHVPLSGVIVDAGCGEGAILERFSSGSSYDRALVGVESNAIRAESASKRLGAARVIHGDFLAYDRTGYLSLVIANPPFRHAMDFVRHALKLVARTNGTVAMLLRLNWLASMERVEFHKKHPADVYVLPKRPAFAASIKCRKPREMCGWHVVQPLTAERPSRCPSCGGDLRVCTTDACEYGWFTWGPGRGGRWFILDLPQTHDIDLAS